MTRKVRPSIRSRHTNERIFSGDYSRPMWQEINSARTVDELAEALYFVCCRLQELESIVRKKGS